MRARQLRERTRHSDKAEDVTGEETGIKHVFQGYFDI